MNSLTFDVRKYTINIFFFLSQVLKLDTRIMKEICNQYECFVRHFSFKTTENFGKEEKHEQLNMT